MKRVTLIHGDVIVRDAEEVPCHNAWECFGSGKGTYTDDLSSAMGGCWFQHCRCMTDDERVALGLERLRPQGEMF